MNYRSKVLGTFQLIADKVERCLLDYFDRPSKNEKPDVHMDRYDYSKTSIVFQKEEKDK
jgi:hypothetical protein